jgi:hypothetical protein
MLSPPLRRVTLAATVLGGLALAAQDALQFRAFGAMTLAEAAATRWYMPLAAAQLAGFLLLLLGLVGLQDLQAERSDRVGWLGFLLAFLATGLAAGAAFFNAFVVPSLAARAPEVLGSPAPALVWATRAGAYGLVLGYALFAIATMRNGLLAKHGAALVAVGAVLTALPLPVGGPVVLGAGLVWVGVDAWLRARRPAAAPAPAPSAA